MRDLIDINGCIQQYYHDHHDKLLLIFPGAGYTYDKPLLYYARLCAIQNGCDVLCLDYHIIKFNKESMTDCIKEGVKIVSQVMESFNLNQYSNIYCIAKSMGCNVAKEILKQLEINISVFYLTPTEYLKSYIENDDIIVTSYEDPMITRSFIESIQNHNHLYIMEGNHSLECKDHLAKTYEQLGTILVLYEDYLNNCKEFVRKNL